MALNRIEEIIEDIRLGRMVILMDDEDRENEGDLIMAAPLVRAEDINFMARYGRGLICLTLTRERCRRLELPLMVSDNNAKHSTNFTVSIEAARNVTTGISAHDRAQTVQAAVAPLVPLGRLRMKVLIEEWVMPDHRAPVQGHSRQQVGRTDSRQVDNVQVLFLPEPFRNVEEVRLVESELGDPLVGDQQHRLLVRAVLEESGHGMIFRSQCRRL